MKLSRFVALASASLITFIYQIDRLFVYLFCECWDKLHDPGFSQNFVLDGTFAKRRSEFARLRTELIKVWINICRFVLFATATNVNSFPYPFRIFLNKTRRAFVLWGLFWFFVYVVIHFCETKLFLLMKHGFSNTSYVLRFVCGLRPNLACSSSSFEELSSGASCSILKIPAEICHLSISFMRNSCAI